MSTLCNALIKLVVRLLNLKLKFAKIYQPGMRFEGMNVKKLRVQITISSTYLRSVTSIEKLVTLSNVTSSAAPVLWLRTSSPREVLLRSLSEKGIPA